MQILIKKNKISTFYEYVLYELGQYSKPTAILSSPEMADFIEWYEEKAGEEILWQIDN